MHIWEILIIITAVASASSFVVYRIIRSLVLKKKPDCADCGGRFTCCGKDN